MGVNIDLRIDELVLHGFPATSRDRIADALRAELTRLLLRESGSKTTLESASRDGVAATVRLPYRASPERTGRALANSLHTTLRSEPKEAPSSRSSGTDGR